VKSCKFDVNWFGHSIYKIPKFFSMHNMINLLQIVNEGEYDVVIMIIGNDLLKIVWNNYTQLE
jgi:hypothetical protein